MPSDAPAPRRAGWRDVARALKQARVRVTLMLGFSSGLPFMLVGNTLGFWLRDDGVALSAIGVLSGVGLAYSLKFLWAPLIDKADAPLFGAWLGRRRGWMALAQLVVFCGLAAMALVGPEHGLTRFGLLALIAAFGSATQDIVIDAWRIESAASDDEQGLLTAAFQTGYRAALLIADSLILILAGFLGWSASYGLMAVLMLLGLYATLRAIEPTSSALKDRAPTLWTARGLFDAIAGPFIAFFREHGRWALLMLLAVALYRLPDFAMGPMANPFYKDLGFAKEVVGAVRSSIGLIASIAGIAAGGLCAVRFGFVPTLLIGAVVGPGSNLAFAALAYHGADVPLFSIVMAIDNFSTGFAGTALVAYMSSLTSLGYTATQYALLSSFYALPGKLAKVVSGGIVEALEPSRGLMGAYALFFTGTAVIGIPALLLCMVLVRRRAVAPTSASLAE
ncbi:AmpG family muropeptide MFS transporter [Hydrocarboniphaga sp.]|uniref:AmpG family muropeptide MFS transporter n=1 Tax=Hydrocarboniphaga sp. TaxID=2033016 RepID=UPI003D0E9C73